MVEIKTKGLWWIPDNPQHQLSGEIVYGPTIGAQLSLLDHFFKDSDEDRYTVWGMTVTGKPVTLFDCYTKNLMTHVPGARVAELNSYFGVVGGHFRTPEDLKFATIYAEISHLNKWTWRSGIRLSQDNSNKNWQVTLDFVPEISLGAVGSFKIGIAFSSQLTPDFGCCRLAESCRLRIESDDLTSYESFQEILNGFQNFVALGVSRPVYALSISGRLNTSKQIIEGHEIYEEFEMIRKLHQQETQEVRTPYDMQFHLEDLQPDPAAYVKLYFEKHQLLEPVCDLYFSTLYNPEMYVHQRFLSLAHAVEAYHRAFVGGKYQTDDEYRNGLQKLLWDAIPREIDSDFRASLKNKLRYLHEYSLRKRVRDICLRDANVLNPFLGEPSDFAGAVADQRNLLTHPDSTAEDQPPETDWKSIWLKSEQLSLLIEVCLLRELGFTNTAIAKLLRRNRRIRAIQLNRK